MKELQLKKISKMELGYLVGLFMGDGYSYHDKKRRHYILDFYLNSEKDKDIINFIIKLLRRLNLNTILYKDKRYNCMRIRVHSIELFNLLLKMRINSVLYRNLSKNQNFRIGFISGVIDSEGYINFNRRYIQIVNTNRNLMGEVKKILRLMNIDSSIKKRSKSRKDKLDSYSLYVSVKFIKTKNISLKVKRYINFPEVKK